MNRFANWLRRARVGLTAVAAMLMMVATASVVHAAPPTPLPASVLAGQTSLSVTNASSRVALPYPATQYNAITLVNIGTSDAFYATGDVTVAATTSSKRIAACSHYTVYTGDAYVAAITGGTDTTTLRIYQGNGPLDYGQGCASTVSGTVTANQGTAGAGPWLVALPTGASTAANQTTALARGKNFQIAPTITVQNAAYSAGNSEGGLITVTGAAGVNGGGGLLDAIRLKSTGGSTNAIWVYVWSKTPASTCTDKSAFVPNAADAAYALPGFPIQVTLGTAPGAWDTSTYAYTTGNTNVSNFKNQDSVAGTAIYVCLVTAASVTPASTSDLSMVLGGVQD